MRLFIGWSGSRSEAIANVLGEWLPSVLPTCEVLSPAAVSVAELVAILRRAEFGVICVTPDNGHDPWLYCQAGALSRSVGGSSAAVLHVTGVDPEHLDPLLAEYEAVGSDRAGIERLVALASHADAEPTPAWEGLRQAIHREWPVLKNRLSELERTASAPTADAADSTTAGNPRPIAPGLETRPSASDDLDEAMGRAIAAQQAAVASHPDDPAAQAGLGDLLLREGRALEAESAYRRSLQLNPSDGHASNGLAAALLMRGQTEQAIALLRGVIEEHPKDPVAWRNLGNALRRQGSVDEALTALEQAVQFGARNDQAWISLAGVRRSMGDLDGAADALRQAIALAPDDPTAHMNLGRVMRQQGRLDEAVQAQRRAVSLAPTSAEAHKSLGTTLRLRGEFEEAATAFRRAIDLEPTLAGAHNDLAVTLLGLGRLDAAVAVLHQSVELLQGEIARAPHNHKPYNDLGVAYFHQGELGKAIVVLRKAIEMAPDDASLRRNLERVIHAQEVRTLRARV